MKLTYWVAAMLNDSPAYSIRAKTLKEVRAKLTSQEATLTDRAGEPAWCTPHGAAYAPPRRVEVEYADGFDLVVQALGEGGIDEG